MKKSIILFSAAVVLVLAGCNNNTDKKTGSDEVKADSLYKDVMEGHDIGMAKTPALSKMQSETKRVLDSIALLPAKAQEAAAPYKTQLESLAKELKDADDAMNKWMEEFNFDSAKNDLEKRIQYLSEEKLKVNNVKIAILGSLHKADSLLKRRF